MRYDDIMKYEIFDTYLSYCIKVLHKKIDQHEEDIVSKTKEGKIIVLQHKFGLIDIELLAHGRFSNCDSLKRAFDSQIKYQYTHILREAFTKEQEKIKQSLKEKQELEELLLNKEKQDKTNIRRV